MQTLVISICATFVQSQWFWTCEVVHKWHSWQVLSLNVLFFRLVELNMIEILYPYALTFLSAVLFTIYSLLLEKNVRIPETVEKKGKRIKWINIVISLTHSSLSSVSVLICFYMDPNLASDIINNFSYESYTAASFSLGYFIHDFIHVIRHQKLKTAWEILLHHVVVIICFGVAVTSYKYIGYVIVALLCEINSIFLHIRQLMNMVGFSNQCILYRINSLVNITTYILFRICTLTWMTRWIILHRSFLLLPVWLCGVGGMTSMTIINIVLFARLLLKDYSFHRPIAQNFDANRMAKLK